jgi:hypothetical protein
MRACMRVWGREKVLYTRLLMLATHNTGVYVRGSPPLHTYTHTQSTVISPSYSVTAQ